MSKEINIPIINTFTKGMNRDVHATFLRDGEVTYRLNGAKENNRFYGGSEVNQNGNVKIVGLPTDIVGSIMIEERGWIIFFSRDKGKDTIGYVNKHDGTYTEILNAQEFGCEWNFKDCEWLSIDYDYISGCDELKLYFSSNWVYYHVNIDEMLDIDRKATLKEILQPIEEGKCGITDCSYFKSFRATCGVRTIPIKHDKGGFNLMAGVYQVAVRLIDANGVTSNVFNASEPINIGSENNIAGERSAEYISIYLDNLDCAYHIAQIIIIKTIGGITTASIVAEKHYENGQTSHEYYGSTEEEIPITLEEVRVKRKSYLEGKDIFIHNNKAWYYNLKPDKNPDLQRKVQESTKAQIGIYEVPLEDVQKYGYKTLMRSERYLFGITYNIVGKGWTPVYVLIPGAAPSEGQLPLGNSIPVESQPDEVIYNYEAAKVIRYRGSAPEGCTTCGGGGGTCSGGTCSSASGIEFRSQSQEESEEQEVVNSLVANIKSAIEQIDTTVSDICGVLDCTSQCCTEGECCNSPCDECECEYKHKGAEICNSDWSDLEDMYSTVVQWATGLSKDEVNPTITDKSLKEAALALITEGVENKENKAYVAPTYTTDMDGVVLTNNLPPQNGEEGSDNNVDSKGNKLVPDHVVKKFTRDFHIYETDETYPDTLNCNGDYIYGEYAKTHVRLFEMPSANELPIYRTKQSGVVMPEYLGNTEYSKHYINLAGLIVSNIYIPTEEELGGKLCKEQPWEIVMAEVTSANSRVVAKGIVHGTFEGIVNGRTYAYPKHAVNSLEKIDRYINNNKSRKGSPKTGNRFIFHSLDTNVFHLGLAVDKLKVESKLGGYGYRYGLYAEGEEPEDQTYGHKTDMRGCRSAHSLTDNSATLYGKYENGTLTPTPFKDLGYEYDITGITYAKADRIITPPKGIDLPLMNRGRESSVYFQSTGLEDYDDISFIGDVLEHSRPLGKGYTSYISLLRNNTNQYGSLVNQVYISTGLSGHSGSITNGVGRTEGICGDAYIGFNSVKRSSYISDKVGDYYNIPAMDNTKRSPRTVCEQPETWDQDILGLWYPTKLPESGDVGNAKNWAGLHTSYTRTDNYIEAIAGREFPASEAYYPRTLNHMNYFIGESRVCPWLLQTGAGSQIELKKVYYPNLKDLDLDPTLTGRVWEECFLPQFINKVEQPSKAQMKQKFWIKAIINELLPALHLSMTALLTDPVQLAGWSAVSPVLVGGWLYLKENLLSDNKINELLGIPTCKTDSEGGNYDTDIQGFKDNYLEYNRDYSAPNRINIFRGMTDPYYTCDCDDKTSNEIHPSRMKMTGSQLDNYLSVAPLDAVLVPKKYGNLQKLFFESGRFFAHTDKQLLILQEGATAISTTSGLSLSMTGGGLLDIPEGRFKTVPEGFIGLQDPNASYTTPFGQIFIDSNARAIYLLQGGNPEKISGYGMNDFFWNHIPFDCGGCRDERKGLDYLFGADYKNKQLYFTKKGCNCDFTVAYDLVEKMWRSFYSFIPDFYIWDRDSLYTVAKNSLWQHNVGEPQIYYDTYYPYELEFAIKQSPIFSDIVYKSTILDTMAYSGDSKDIPATFNKGAIYNSTQSSGVKNLNLLISRENTYERIKETSSIRVDRDGRKFNINEFKNNAAYGETITKEVCFYDEIQPVSNTTGADTLLYDDYLMMRLILDNPEQNIKLFTKSVATLIQPRNDS